MTTYPVDIVFNATGGKKVKTEIDAIAGSAETTSSALSGLKGILAGLAAGFGVAKLIEYADGYAVLQARLRGVSADAAEYALVSDRLTSVANDSRAGIEETANLYAKLKIGTQGLSFSTEDLLGVTGSLQKTFALSGATAEQAKNAIIQLNQGIGAGALRGEEFNAVQEATQGEFGRIIEKAGLAGGKIRELADTGKLSADLIVKSFQKVGADIDARFAQVPLTVGQSFTVLQNAIFNFVGQANQGAGATQLLASAIVFVANNINVLATAVIAGGAAWAAYYATTSIIVPLYTALQTATTIFTVALYGQSTALGALRAAWLALAATLRVNPFVLLVTTIVGVGIALYGLIGNLNLFGSSTVTIGGIVNSTFRLIVQTFELLGQVASYVATVVIGFFSSAGTGGQVLASVLAGLGNIATAVFGAMVQGVTDFFNWIGRLLTSIPVIGPYLADIGEMAKQAFELGVKAVSDFVDWLAKLLDKLSATFPALEKIAKTLESFGVSVKSAANSSQTFGSSLGKAATAASSTTQAVTSAAKSTDAFKTSTETASSSLRDLGDAAAPAFGAVVSGAQSAVSAVEGLRSSVGGLKSGLADFGSGGKSVNGLSNASSAGGFTINTLPEYGKWLANFGARPVGNAQSVARLFYDYAKALTNTDTGGKLPQAQVASFRSRISAYKENLSDEERASLGNMWDSLQKFRSGGSFMVGGSNSQDSNLVMLRATKGERVDVTSKADQAQAARDARTAGRDRANVIQITINTPDADSFRRSGQQVLSEFANRLSRATNA